MSHYDTETGLIKVSWSKVRLAEECRQKAYLISEGMKSPAADVRVFFQGNVVDMAMRRWLAMEDPPAGWMVQQVDAIMDELERKVREEKEGVVRWKHQADRDQVREFCRECAKRLEPLLRQVALPYDYQPAKRFSTELTIPGLDGNPVKILLTGEMDLLTKERQAAVKRFRVWDLKATKSADYWRKTVAQLVFYDIACMCLFGVSVVEAGLLQPMVDGRPYISFVPSDQDRTEMFTRIITVAHSIMREDFRPKADTVGCNYCEVHHACSRYKVDNGRVNLWLCLDGLTIRSMFGSGSMWTVGDMTSAGLGTAI